MYVLQIGESLLQIGEALFHCKLGQTLSQIGAALLLQIVASVVTNWGSYYKLQQNVSQIGAFFYKLGQLLQIRA